MFLILGIAEHSQDERRRRSLVFAIGHNRIKKTQLAGGNYSFLFTTWHGRGFQLGTTARENPASGDRWIASQTS